MRDLIRTTTALLLACCPLIGCSDEGGGTVAAGADTQSPDDSASTDEVGDPDVASGSDTDGPADGASSDLGAQEDVPPIAGEDVPKQPCDLPAEAGCPCANDSACESLACVSDGTELRCAAPCLDCEGGTSCGAHVPLGTSTEDTLLVCLPVHAWLCQPCKADAECGQFGVCDPTGDAGSFCATDCNKAACPNGFSCDDGRCRPDSGQCECNTLGTNAGASTSCASTNAAGQCAGARGCGADGLTACNALTPTAEACNGIDDDCNGATDDCSDGDITTEGDACDQGVCKGTPIDCSDLDDPCHVGVVDGLTGKCVAEARDDGTTCDDQDACTPYSECQSGECTGLGFSCEEQQLSLDKSVSRRPSLAPVLGGFAAHWTGTGAGAVRFRRVDGEGSVRGEERTLPGQGAGFPIYAPLTPLPDGGVVALQLGTFPASANTCGGGACPYNGWAFAAIPLFATAIDATGAASEPTNVGTVYGVCHTGPGSISCNGPSPTAVAATLIRFGDGAFGMVSAYQDHTTRPITLTVLDDGLSPEPPVTLESDLRAPADFAATLIPDGSDRILLAWISADGRTLRARTYQRDGAPESEAVTVATVTPGQVVVAKIVSVNVAAYPNGRTLVVWESVTDETPGTELAARRYDPDLGPLGDEIPVGAGADGDQRLGGVSVFSDYGFVVVWDDPESDGSGRGIVAQRFEATGTPASVPAPLNLRVEGEQTLPAVTTLPGNDYVVAWSDAGVLRSRRFTQDGAPVAGATERLAHLAVTGDQLAPAMAALGDGRTAVAFEAPVFPGKASEIRLSILGSDGEWEQRELTVNATTAFVQAQPDVAAGAGGLVVAWMSEDQDGSIDGVIARQFDLAGAPTGPEILVNQTTEGAQSRPVVAAGDSGTFLVAWVSEAAGGPNVMARGFDAGGLPAGGELLVNAFTSGSQDRPAISRVPGSSEAIVAWQSAGSDGDGAGIALRRVSLAGAGLSDEMQANTTVAGDQRDPSVAVSPTGRIAACWTHGGAESDIRCQVLKPDFAVVGAEFTPHATDPATEAASAVGWLPGGDLLVSWQSDVTDGSDNAVHLARFDSQGNPVSSRVVVNRTWALNQRGPRLAPRPNGDVVVAWESEGESADGFAVALRLVAAP